MIIKVLYSVHTQKKRSPTNSRVRVPEPAIIFLNIQGQTTHTRYKNRSNTHIYYIFINVCFY